MKIIAFGHRKGTGKDTAARFLATELRMRYKGIHITKVGFADKVKDIAYQLYAWAGLQPGHFYEEEVNRPLREIVLAKIGKTPREIWIGVGNGIRSAVGYDGTWLDYVFNSIKTDVLIISDLRFPAEAYGILNAGGFIYRIDCPWAAVVTDGADDKLAMFEQWTGVINNDEFGNQNKLYTQIKTLVDLHWSKNE